MRLTVSGLITAALLCSMAFADEQPAPSVPAAPAAAPAPADAAVAAESAAAATQATAAQPAAAASEAAGAHPAAAPEAGDKPASATTSAEDAAAAAAAAKDEAAAMDEQMKRLGYKVTMMDGEKRYCKTATVMGSRLNTRNLCWTPDQVRSHQSNVDYMREKQGQQKTFGR